MPRFFDSANLSERQRRNWDHAVERYLQVREERIRALVETGVPEERARGYTHLMFCDPDVPESMENSALFARMLNGADPLPFPPPCSYSCPWYEVVEEPGPFPVAFGGLAWLGKDRRPRGAMINQYWWRLLSMNRAAEDLLAGRLRKNVVEACPMIEVASGQWSGYRLTVGRGLSPIDLSWTDCSRIPGGFPFEPACPREGDNGILECEVNQWLLVKDTFDEARGQAC